MAQASIVIPTYNHQDYIRECLQSVIAQTFKDWQAIIIDDGSTDDTNKIAREYAESDSRFQLITQANRGLKYLGENYNKALGACSGKWISVLEGDDYWHPEKLSCFLKHVENTDAVMAWGTAYTVDSTSKTTGKFPRKKFLKNANNRPVGAFLGDYLLSSFIPSPSLMFRADSLHEAGGFSQPENMTVVDYPTVLAISLKGEFRFLEVPLVYYRIHSSQATSSGGVEADSAALYAEAFFSNLPKAVIETTGLTQQKLNNRIAQRRALNHFHRGRTALIQKEYKTASQFFKTMRECRSPGIIVRSYLGSIHSKLNLNLEWIARLLGLRALK